MNIKKLNEELEITLNEISDEIIRKVGEKRGQNYSNAYTDFFDNDGSPDALKNAKKKLDAHYSLKNKHDEFKSEVSNAPKFYSKDTKWQMSSFGLNCHLVSDKSFRDNLSISLYHPTEKEPQWYGSLRGDYNHDRVRIEIVKEGDYPNVQTLLQDLISEFKNQYGKHSVIDIPEIPSDYVEEMNKF